MRYKFYAKIDQGGNLQNYWNFRAPCDGYLVNTRLYVINTAEPFWCIIAKHSPEIDALLQLLPSGSSDPAEIFPDSREYIRMFGRTALIPPTSTPVTYHTAYSKNARIYLKRGESATGILGGTQSQDDCTIIGFSDFIPAEGSYLTMDYTVYNISNSSLNSFTFSKGFVVPVSLKNARVTAEVVVHTSTQDFVGTLTIEHYPRTNASAPGEYYSSEAIAVESMIDDIGLQSNLTFHHGERALAVYDPDGVAGTGRKTLNIPKVNGGDWILWKIDEIDGSTDDEVTVIIKIEGTVAHKYWAKGGSYVMATGLNDHDLVND